jgi:hypothetical protein
MAKRHCSKAQGREGQPASDREGTTLTCNINSILDDAGI